MLEATSKNALAIGFGRGDGATVEDFNVLQVRGATPLSPSLISLCASGSSERQYHNVDRRAATDPYETLSR
jgi:hypothetical protein